MKWYDCIFSFVVPAIYIAIGIAFKKHPPKEINSVSGWRTQRSMQNQETWNFANTLGGKCFLALGCIEVICTAILLLFASRLFANAIAPIVLQTACMAIVIVYVQRKLKTHFRQ